MTHMLHVAGALCLCLAPPAVDAPGAWTKVADFSTADTCRGVEGIAFHAGTRTLMAVSGNRILQLTTDGRLLGSYRLKDDPQPRLRGIQGLPSGNLLLVAENTHRLYEITLAGKCLEARPIAAGMVPRGVTYSEEQKRVFVADRADKSLKQYSAGRYAGQTATLPVADLHGIECAGPGTFLVLDRRQRKVFQWSAGGAFREFVDLAQVCGYTGPSGLTLDHQRGMLYICFDESERIVAVDVSRELGQSVSQTSSVQTPVAIRTIAPQTPVSQSIAPVSQPQIVVSQPQIVVSQPQAAVSQPQAPTSSGQVQIPRELIQRVLLQIQQQQQVEPLGSTTEPLPGPAATGRSSPQAGPSPSELNSHPAVPADGSSPVVVPSPYSPSQIIVRPTSPTIYILPIIIGNAGQAESTALPASPASGCGVPGCSSPGCGDPEYRAPAGRGHWRCLPGRW